MQLELNKITDDTCVGELKQEIYEWAQNAAQLSGLCDGEKQADQYATEKTLDVFKNYPSKHNFFEFKMGSQVVGRAWMMQKDNTKQPEFRLAYIKVDEPYQKQKIAAEAIALLEAYSLEQGYNELTLNVFGHLQHAARLYKRLGYVSVNELKRNDRLIATEMAKTIVPKL